MEGGGQPVTSNKEAVVLTAMILICSLTADSDLAACNQANAVTVISVPETYGNPATCFMHGQAYLAETSIGRELTADERIKVICARKPAKATASVPMP
jgi:hypothetical protein